MSEPMKCQWCGTIHPKGLNTLCPLTILELDDVQLEHDVEAAPLWVLPLANGLRKTLKKLEAQRDAEKQLKDLRRLVGIDGLSVSLRDRLLRLLAYEQEVNAAWFQIDNGFEMESREQLEAEAKTNGFHYGLAQAVHHMWKRTPKGSEPSHRDMCQQCQGTRGGESWRQRRPGKTFRSRRTL